MSGKCWQYSSAWGPSEVTVSSICKYRQVTNWSKAKMTKDRLRNCIMCRKKGVIKNNELTNFQHQTHGKHYKVTAVSQIEPILKLTRDNPPAIPNIKVSQRIHINNRPDWKNEKMFCREVGGWFVHVLLTRRRISWVEGDTFFFSLISQVRISTPHKRTNSHEPLYKLSHVYIATADFPVWQKYDSLEKSGSSINDVLLLLFSF